MRTSLFDSDCKTRAALQSIRRDLHAHPELAFCETRTADVVVRELTALGIETHCGLAKTGVVGVLRAGSSERAIGLRADMDALPINEANDFAHRSVFEGCMHACGHDGHTTMLLGAAKLLAASNDFDGTVYLIFQPAEESSGGARVMIEEGLFEQFPMEAIYGMHNWPGLPAGDFAVHAGPVMAGTDRFDIRIRGIGGHAAMPHLTVDPLYAGTALVQAVQSVASRSLDPFDAAVVAVTCFHAGDAYNVVPGQAELSGTLRSFSETVRQKALTRLTELCAGVSKAFGVEIDFSVRDDSYPPTINTAAHALFCQQAAVAIVGHEHVHTDERPSMGAEDFSFYLRHKPGAYIWIGNDPADGNGHGLHNPSYDFNDDILSIGAAYWVELVRHILGQGARNDG
ncbi:MAG: M20 family metallopeptidase [Betaproteobacteria bacterium]|nr:M20 family metallopeptidase [Betaproteobacteria bacterium]